MFHHAIRHVVALPQRDDRRLLPPEVELDHHVTAVARQAPTAGRLGAAAGGGQHGGGDRGRGIAPPGGLGARGAAPWLHAQIRGAHAAAAMRARRAMALTHALSTDGTRPDLIRCEQRRRLVRAGRPVPRAHEAPRFVGAAQVGRAVHLSVHHAHGLMRRADRSAAAGALRHLVHAHRLVGPALTVLETLRAQTTASLGRLGVALLRVPVADDPAATAARREARRAGLVTVFGADVFVRRAVLEPARRADAHVLITRRLPVHATLGDAVVRAEVLGANRAA